MARRLSVRLSTSNRTEIRELASNDPRGLLGRTFLASATGEHCATAECTMLLGRAGPLDAIAKDRRLTYADARGTQGAARDGIDRQSIGDMTTEEG